MSIRSYGEPWKDDHKGKGWNDPAVVARVSQIGADALKRADAIAAAERAVIEASVAWRTAFGLDQDEWSCKRDLFAAIDSLLALTRAQGGGAK